MKKPPKQSHEKAGAIARPYTQIELIIGGAGWHAWCNHCGQSCQAPTSTKGGAEEWVRKWMMEPCPGPSWKVVQAIGNAADVA